MKKDNKDKTDKKERHKAGWRVTDRLCGLCGELIPVDKYLNSHHISYGDNKASNELRGGHPVRKADIKKSLHYNCHNIIHCRVKYHNPYDKKYSKDFGPVAVALAVLKLYKPVLKEALEYIREVDRRNNG